MAPPLMKLAMPFIATRLTINPRRQKARHTYTFDHLKSSHLRPHLYRNNCITLDPDPQLIGCYLTQKMRDFYNALDKDSVSKSMYTICKELKIDYTTGLL